MKSANTQLLTTNKSLQKQAILNIVDIEIAISRLRGIKRYLSTINAKNLVQKQYKNDRDLIEKIRKEVDWCDLKKEVLDPDSDFWKRLGEKMSVCEYKLFSIFVNKAIKRKSEIFNKMFNFTTETRAIENIDAENIISKSIECGISPINLMKKMNARFDPKWTKDEEERLKSAITKYGNGNWKKISVDVCTKNPRQCLHKTKTVSFQGRLRRHWTKEEDEKLKMRIEEYGTNWTKVSYGFETRDDIQCKNRYFLLCSRIDGKIKKWTKEEDELLIFLYNEHKGNWKRIEEGMKNKTRKQIRYRVNKMQQCESPDRRKF